MKGPKGELTQKLNDGITVKIDGTTLTVERNRIERASRPARFVIAR